MVNLAKKIKKGIAEGSRRAGNRALFSKLLSFILSLLILVSAFPSTVFAKDISINQVNCSVLFAKGNISVPVNNEKKQIPAWFSNSSVKQRDVINSNVIFDFEDSPFDLSDGDVVTIKIGINNGVASRYKSFALSDILCTADNINGSFHYVDESDVRYDVNTSTFIIKFTSNNDYKNFRFSFGVWIKSCEYLDNSFIIGCTSVDINIQSKSDGFFDNIKEWFSNLFELLTSKFSELGQNITKIGQDVGDWFSNLSQSIQTFFSELKDKLTDLFNDIKQSLSEWFESVGQWFKDLGDKISGFFESLWQNFKNFFDDLGQKISDWWQSVVDFFHNLFVPEDGYFEKYKQDWEDWARSHFALFYDVMDIVNDIFVLFTTEFGDSDHLVITIPELSLPVLDHNVFMEETFIDLGSLINSHNSFRYCYNIYRIAFSGACYFMLLKYLQKTLSEVITGDGDTL